jgi:hypothetical protein
VGLQAAGQLGCRLQAAAGRTTNVGLGLGLGLGLGAGRWALGQWPRAALGPSPLGGAGAAAAVVWRVAVWRIAGRFLCLWLYLGRLLLARCWCLAACSLALVSGLRLGNADVLYCRQ